MTLSRGAPVVPIVLLACLRLAGQEAKKDIVEFQAGDPVADAEGVRLYPVVTNTQAKPIRVRILPPSKLPDEGSRHFLFVLPIEPQGDNRYGDGLMEIRKLGLHDKFGLIIVAPDFAEWPWYADHPTDLNRRDETCLVKGVLPFVDRAFPSKEPKRLLLGFSRSGWGAFSLILRHPGLFSAACAWDAPLMKDNLDPFEMPRAFGTQANFQRYQVSRLLEEKAEAFRASKRLGLLGYGAYRDHLEGARALMEKLKIPCEIRDGPQRRHAWDSGWVPEAVGLLDAMAR